MLNNWKRISSLISVGHNRSSKAKDDREDVQPAIRDGNQDTTKRTDSRNSDPDWYQAIHGGPDA